MPAAKRVRKKLRRKWILGISAALIIIGILFMLRYVQRLYGPIVRIGQEDSSTVYVYIPRGATFNQVMEQLCKLPFIEDCAFFIWLARQMNYDRNVYPGRYKLTSDMGYVDIIRKLRSGAQDPIRLTWLKFRTLKDAATFFGKHLEPTPEEFMQVFTDTAFLMQFGLNEYTLISIFIPNTYEFYWTTTPKQLIRRMVREFNRFWTPERRKKAKELGLTPIEVIILASIVEEETWRDDEKSRIAGVYINRLRRGMLLQADPTVRFAIGDFSIKRITYAMTRINSPYNTYIHPGLPPGPICTPSPSTIDAVLNAEEHDYLYFVARPDGSGYHYFSRTYEEHLNYARLYHKKLDELGL